MISVVNTRSTRKFFEGKWPDASLLALLLLCLPFDSLTTVSLISRIIHDLRQGAALFLDRILPSMVLKLWHKFRVISLLGSSATCIFFCCVVCHLSLHTTTAIIIHFAVNAVSVSLLSSLPFSADISLQSSAIRLSTTKHTASNVQPFTVLMCLRPSPTWEWAPGVLCCGLDVVEFQTIQEFQNMKAIARVKVIRDHFYGDYFGWYFVHVYHGRVWM